MNIKTGKQAFELDITSTYVYLKLWGRDWFFAWAGEMA